METVEIPKLELHFREMGLKWNGNKQTKQKKTKLWYGFGFSSQDPEFEALSEAKVIRESSRFILHKTPKHIVHVTLQ